MYISCSVTDPKVLNTHIYKEVLFDYFRNISPYDPTNFSQWFRVFKLIILTVLFKLMQLIHSPLGFKHV
jgi:hypothetical protein